MTLREMIPDLVEKYFPKGKCKERGAAIVLATEIYLKAIELIPEKKSGDGTGFEFTKQLAYNNAIDDTMEIFG